MIALTCPVCLFSEQQAGARSPAAAEENKKHCAEYYPVIFLQFIIVEQCRFGKGHLWGFLNGLFDKIGLFFDYSYSKRYALRQRRSHEQLH